MRGQVRILASSERLDCTLPRTPTGDSIAHSRGPWASPRIWWLMRTATKHHHTKQQTSPLERCAASDSRPCTTSQLVTGKTISPSSQTLLRLRSTTYRSAVSLICMSHDHAQSSFSKHPCGLPRNKTFSQCLPSINKPPTQHKNKRKE